MSQNRIRRPGWNKNINNAGPIDAGEGSPDINLPRLAKALNKRETGAFQPLFPVKTGGKSVSPAKPPLMLKPANTGSDKRVSLRPGIQQQLERSMEKVDIVKKKLTQPDRSTTFRPTSSSTTPQTTTSASATSSTSSASDYTTTSTSMANRNRNQSSSERTSKSNEDKLDQSRALFKPVNSDFQKQETSASFYLPQPSTSPVMFSVAIPDTTLLDNGEVSTLDTILRPKLMFNTNSFYSAWQVPRTSNEFMYDNQSNLFSSITLDVLNGARSNLLDAWDLTNFRASMSAVCKALEYIYTLDSILSYNPDQGGNYWNYNRTTESYRAYFATSAILEKRTKLRNALRNTWFFADYCQQIRWFYQYYRTSDLSQANFYRYLPVHVGIGLDSIASCDFLVTGNSLPSTSGVTNLLTRIDSLITNLQDPVNRKIYALLARVYPSSAIASIPDCYNDAVYDNRHFEMFINEPVCFTDPNVTYPTGSTYSVYPVANTLTNNAVNDIPYYQNSDPHSNGEGGYSFSMQSIRICADASGNLVVNNYASRKYQGIRHIDPVAGSASGSSGYSATCNKFTFLSSGDSYSRVMVPRFVLGTSDSHIVTKDGSTSFYLSKPNSGFQQVYFNNQNAPRILQTQLFETLVNLIPRH